jgi:hypothetical protein
MEQPAADIRGADGEGRDRFGGGGEDIQQTAED